MRDNNFAVLTSQNPWWRDPSARVARHLPVRRREFDRVVDRLQDVAGRAVVLMGPRQTGKTTLLGQAADHFLDLGLPPHDLLRCDFEDPRFDPPPTLGDVLEAAPVRSREAQPRVCLFDEVHASPRWSTWLKRLVDDRAGRFLVADSATALLRDRGAESGVGRWDEITFPYLSFRDFVRLRQPMLLTAAGDEVPPPLAVPELEAYLAHGGFPGHVREDRLSLVRSRIREDVAARAIERDLTVLAGLRNARPLKGLFVALVTESGSLFDATARGRDLGTSRQTIDQWLDLLVSTRLLATLPRYARGMRKTLRAHPKVYAADPALVGAFSIAPDPASDAATIARTVETAAHRHLLALEERWAARLGFYREGDVEVDFVLQTRPGTLVLEVHSARTPDRSKAIWCAEISSRLEGARPAVTSLLPRTYTHRTSRGQVKEVPLWRLLLLLDECPDAEALFAWLES